MGLYSDHILPRGIAWAMGGAACAELRPTCVAAARGRVLELGFGAGHNVPHYGPGVSELLALEPSILARKLARDRVAAARFPVTFVGLDGAAIPLDASSVDAVVSTWTLCSIPDVAGALAEVRRVLVPGGRLFFLDHGLSPEPRVARWQRRLNRFQMWWAGGCRVDLEIDSLVRAAGLDLEHCEEFHMLGPRYATYMYRGVGLSP